MKSLPPHWLAKIEQYNMIPKIRNDIVLIHVPVSSNHGINDCISYHTNHKSSINGIN